MPSFNPLPYSHLGLVSISKYISSLRLPLPSTAFHAAIRALSVVSHHLSLFVSLVHLRGRTRGRAVVDEEDSMDGTEIAESMGPQDTGKALDLPSSHCRRVCCVCSDGDLNVLIEALSCRVHQRGVSVKVVFLSSRKMAQSLFWHPLLQLQS